MDLAVLGQLNLAGKSGFLQRSDAGRLAAYLKVENGATRAHVEILAPALSSAY